MAATPYQDGRGPTTDRKVWNELNALHAGAGEGFVGPGGWCGGYAA